MNRTSAPRRARPALIAYDEGGGHGVMSAADECHAAQADLRGECRSHRLASTDSARSAGHVDVGLANLSLRFGGEVLDAGGIREAVDEIPRQLQVLDAGRDDALGAVVEAANQLRRAIRTKPQVIGHHHDPADGQVGKGWLVAFQRHHRPLQGVALVEPRRGVVMEVHRVAGDTGDFLHRAVAEANQVAVLDPDHLVVEREAIGEVHRGAARRDAWNDAGEIEAAILVEQGQDVGGDAVDGHAHAVGRAHRGQHRIAVRKVSSILPGRADQIDARRSESGSLRRPSHLHPPAADRESARSSRPTF